MKSRLPIIVALIAIIGSVVAIRVYIKRVQQQAEDKLKGPKILVARRDIAAGKEIDRSMIIESERPASLIPAQALTGKDAALIMGQKTRFKIKMNQPILASDFELERTGGFESVIPPGERAFTVNLSRGVPGGLIQPSDHVDILATFALPDTSKAPADKKTPSWRDRSDMVNIVLLQNVTVLAVGNTFMLDSSGGAGSDQITVAVTLPEAQLLMFAAQHGELGAVLRKHDDMATLSRQELPRVTFTELEGLIGDLDTRRKDRIIEIQKGGEVEHVRVGAE